MICLCAHDRRWFAQKVFAETFRESIRKLSLFKVPLIVDCPVARLDGPYRTIHRTVRVVFRFFTARNTKRQESKQAVSRSVLVRIDEAVPYRLSGEVHGKRSFRFPCRTLRNVVWHGMVCTEGSSSRGLVLPRRSA